jgi:hypothetical protein
VSEELSQLDVPRRTGDEPFHIDETLLSIKLLDFWRWSVSDLVSNLTRGRLAEFIVAMALEIDVNGPRGEMGRV